MTRTTYRMEIYGLSPGDVKFLLDYTPSSFFKDFAVYPEGITGPLHYEIDEMLERVPSRRA